MARGTLNNPAVNQIVIDLISKVNYLAETLKTTVYEASSGDTSHSDAVEGGSFSIIPDTEARTRRSP